MVILLRLHSDYQESESLMPEEKAKLLLNVFDGTRRPIPSDVNILVTLRDGNQKEVHRAHHQGPSIEFSVPFYG